MPLNAHLAQAHRDLTSERRLGYRISLNAHRAQAHRDLTTSMPILTYTIPRMYYVDNAQG